MLCAAPGTATSSAPGQLRASQRALSGLSSAVEQDNDLKDQSSLTPFLPQSFPRDKGSLTTLDLVEAG